MRYLRPKGLPPAGSASNLVPRRAFKTQRSVLNWMALGLLGLVGCPTAQPTPDPLAATSGTIEFCGQSLDLKTMEVECTLADVTDLSPLAGLTGLTELYLTGTPAEPADVDALRQALPNCEIDF